MLRELDKANHLWDVIVDPARKIRLGNKLYFGEGDELSAEVIDNTTSRAARSNFWEGTPDTLKAKLDELGETPA